MEEFLENIIKAEKTIHSADHMIYVTFPLIKDKKLLLKVLQETKNSVLLCINSILQYENYKNKVAIHNDQKLNFKLFKEKISNKYGITSEDLFLITELIEISEKHKESPFEFMKNNKVVILSNDLIPRTVPIEKIKRFLFLAKNMIKRAKETIKNEAYAAKRSR